MAAYRLTSDADADLIDIARYTRHQWGASQALKYRNQLRLCFEAIASGTARPKDLSHVTAGLGVLRCQHHCVISLRIASEPLLIIAVLHERMDLIARIAERLEN